ncbi:phage PhiH1 repressor protein-like protein [Halogeometricum pallidum JCM 14848]|uniref:Phage PhiH1 repressor protein-like protein n=1 Tax=Halogeometricum pallidum JCM 14848 TaxID=1227487 RepID=M0D7A3_HALPD|nr:winged-helix domain-containing protein [Halogeometricum pallidum]ELZ31381.1 phage PhiH1 repressor protein-like protein [Halogeometricum pallidum JCM 14848]
MSLKDGLILEFLAEHDLELPPKPLYRNLNRHGHQIGYSTVRLRLAELETHGLVEEAGDGGYYQLSELGHDYLKGDIDPARLETEE